MSLKCPHCGDLGEHNQTSAQVFKNGKTHLRVDCGRCGCFVGYHKQGAHSYKERLYQLACDLASASPHQFDELQARADILARESWDKI